MISGIVAGQALQPVEHPMVIEYRSAQEWTHDWSTLSGMTSNGVQIANNRLYGISGGGNTSAAKVFSAAPGETLRVTAEIEETANSSSARYVGVNFGGENNGVLPALPNFVGVGMNGKTPQRWVGASFTGVQLGTKNLGGSQPAGTYRVHVVVDAENISLVVRNATGAAEWSETIPRSSAPNGSAATSVIVWNGFTGGISGPYIGAIGARKSLTPFRTKSNAAGVIEGNGDTVLNRSVTDGWRIQLPPGYNGEAQTPVVLFTHQATTGNRNNPMEETRWSALRQSLSENGYALLSADDGGDRWGNAASVENYAALLQWVRDRVYTGPVFMIGASMGALPMFNAISGGAIRPRAAVAVSPVCNLVAMRANSSFTSAIDAAWGSSSEVTLIEKSAGRNPISADPALFSGVPYRFHAYDGDAIVPPAQHTDIFAPQIATYASSLVINKLGAAHIDAEKYDPSIIVPFFEAHR